MGQAAEAGSLPSAVGLQVPSTPLDGASHAAGSALEAPSRGMDTSSGVVHPLETASEESERPSKQPRILAFFEHEDAEHHTTFDDCEVDELGAYDFSLDEELNNKSDDVSDAALLNNFVFRIPLPNLSLVKVNYFELTPWLITLKSPG